MGVWDLPSTTGVVSLAADQVTSIRPLDSVLAAGTVGVCRISSAIGPPRVVESEKLSIQLQRRSQLAYPSWVPVLLGVPALLDNGIAPGADKAPVARVNPAKIKEKATMMKMNGRFSLGINERI